MTWTATNLVIEIIAGFIGGHLIAAVSKEHSFGALGHSVTGLLGGTFGGYFLQTLAAVVVDSTGQIHRDSDQVTQWFLQAMTGLACGAITTMAAGFARHAIEQRSREEPK
jgi:uncharacterized membrane protein YeaQ/YmgE (transglycosylase-associated protein family)